MLSQRLGNFSQRNAGFDTESKIAWIVRNDAV